MDAPKPLDRKLVLLIEEDAFLANYLGQAVNNEGAHVVGPARSAGEAEALILRMRKPPSVVVVSASLYDSAGGQVSRAVDRMGVPVLLLGKDGRTASSGSSPHDMLTQPFAAYQVVDHIVRVVRAERSLRG